jgi:hypothetical protein
MTHVDWSVDSRFVQINTAGGGLKFFTAPQCDAVASNAPEILERTGTPGRFRTAGPARASGRPPLKSAI